MTELQPSPPGYRAQDDAPRLGSCSPVSCKYRGHCCRPDSLNYNGSVQCYKAANIDYRQTNVDSIMEPQIPVNYNENYYKKNAPGYKNDSGYSESLGFDSFSLPLNERDASSPPPTPPVRDASSLKGVCYGPGHEKYPSWPTAPDCHYDDDMQNSNHTGSHRSKSWTDHTNYPKEKPTQYTRPHVKRQNSSFTQQLKTVMERCEKIPAEAFESRTRNNNAENDQPRLWPSVDREGKSLGDSEYVVPSPPERESLQTKTLSPADLEAYVRSYQDPQISQVELYGESALTQADLEEYTRVQHSQQASYAQSEGYHSYVSSVDSTTTTPFLDRLRRDSEAVNPRPLSAWEDSSTREGRDSVVTTSSGSASSSETLKWHGSMSDVSESSGLPTTRSITSDRWHHGSMSDVSSIGSLMPPSSLVSGSSNKGSLDKWNNESMVGDQHHDNNTNCWDNGNINSKSRSASRSAGDLGSNASEFSQINDSMSDVSQSNGQQGASKQLIAHSARVQTPQRHHSESVLYLDRERSQRKLYPVSTTKLEEEQTVTRPQPSSPKHSQTSVAERISELEKHHQQQQQQQVKYTYLDPDKKLRVSDPTLKVIQKKALLSFYERHQQASWRSEPQLAQNLQNSTNQSNGHSPPPQPPPRPRPTSSRRASSASEYSNAGGWRDRAPKTSSTTDNIPQTNSELSAPRHQHSNSCGSLATDLVGPVIVGPAISIDDWVPERPPKKPHLRTAYSDRLPSPDLPPPSPPNVTDLEVVNCDDPLPPPPPEVSGNQSHDNRRFKPADRSSPSRRSNRRRRPSDGSLSNSPTSPTSPKSPLTNGFDKTNEVLPAIVRSSVRYSISKKYSPNEKINPARRSAEERLAPFGTSEFNSQKYNETGNSRAGPQVPAINANNCIEPHMDGKIKRQESLKSDELKQWIENTRQKPRPQVPVNSKSNQPQTKQSTNRSNGLFNENNQIKSSLLNKYQQRNLYGLPSKYSDPTSPHQGQKNMDNNCENNSQNSPPPLAPRQNSSVIRSLQPPPRPAPLNAIQGSQSKASYLAYRRERGAPDSEGSYKRTMSPSARFDEPVLLKVTSHNQQQSITPSINGHHHNHHNHHNNHFSNNHHNHHNHHNNNNNNNNSYNNSRNNQQATIDEKSEKSPRERLSPQSVEVLNDRNRQLERERRKLVEDICNPRNNSENNVTTIEMTSRNVELLNRKNAETRNNNCSPPSSSSSSSTSPPSAIQRFVNERNYISSPTQTERIISSTNLNNSVANSKTSPNRDWLMKCSSPSVSPQPGIEGLTMVQRTEVVLRVNAPTIDASSQTENLTDSDEEKSTRESPDDGGESLAKPRKKLQEEIDCEELSRDLANQLEPNDKLLPILIQVPEHKKSTDYVCDLFRVESAPQPRIIRPQLSLEESTFLDGCLDNESEEDKKIESIPTTPVSPTSTDDSSSPLSASSPYFTTSESKARFLTRYSQNADDDNQSAEINSTSDTIDLRQKKEELMVRLDKKLVVLRAEQEAVREESELNESLGSRVAGRVSSVARQTEASKYRLHVEEVGKITSLLLSLSGRLARAENALYGMPADHAERKILESKRDKLIDQLEEAKVLKANIDKRSISISAILSKYLNDDEFADYQHFINMKAKLIVEAREIEDKVKLGEEQLAALKEAID